MATATKHATFTLPIDLLEKISKFTKNKSKFTKEALEEKLRREQIQQAMDEMEELRKKTAKFSSEEIVELVRKDRQSH